MREVPPAGAPIREMVTAINQLVRGRNNATGSVTLAANAATTTVTSPNINANAVPVLVPRTANAAAEMGAGTLYVSDVSAGSFTITHANNAQTDREFSYLTLGG